MQSVTAQNAVSYRCDDFESNKLLHYESVSSYLILPAAQGPGVYSASDRNKYQKQKYCLWVVKRRPARKAHDLTAIYEPTVYTIWDP
jgi:hypothetical protein